MGLNTLGGAQVKTVVKSRGQHISNRVYTEAQTIYSIVGVILKEGDLPASPSFSMITTKILSHVE